MKKATYRRQNTSDQILWLLAVVLLGAFIFYMTFSKHGIVQFYKMGQKKQMLQKLNESLSKENKELRRKITIIKNDSDFQEEVARQEYGYVKSNEKIYVFQEKIKTNEKR